MWSRAPLCILLCAATAPAQSQSQPQRLIGYYTSWSVYGRNYHVPDIPAGKITHINYAFAKIAGGRIALGDPYADVDKWYPGDSWAPGALRGCFNRLRLLKQAHPRVKTLISVGGWTWSGNFSDAVLTTQSRQIFAQSCVDFMLRYEFDGVDIDWEYPVAGGLASNTHRTQDKQNFTLFLAELRSRLDQATQRTGQRYLLTIAAAADPAKVQNIEVANLVAYLDWINVMTFDYHGAWGGPPDPVTNFNTPLYPSPGDPTPQPYQSTFNVSTAIDLYLSLGVPHEKLHMGLAFYGRGFAGVSGGVNGLYGAYTGPAANGTWEPGAFDYTDIADNYTNRNGYSAHWDEFARVPWVYSPGAGVMVGYDNPRSIAEKAWFLKSAGIGGAMFWEFSADRRAELLDAVHDELFARPALQAPRRTLSASAPALLTLDVAGGTALAGRSYLVLVSLNGRHPGLALPGGTLPLNLDPLSFVAFDPALGSWFTNIAGVLDGAGSARASYDFAPLAPLPPALVGMPLDFAAWIAAGAAMVPGQASNAVDVFIRP